MEGLLYGNWPPNFCVWVQGFHLFFVFEYRKSSRALVNNRKRFREPGFTINNVVGGSVCHKFNATAARCNGSHLCLLSRIAVPVHETIGRMYYMDTQTTSSQVFEVTSGSSKVRYSIKHATYTAVPV